MDTEPLWDRLGTLKIANTSVLILSLEDLLIVAVINGVKENWRNLRRISDIADLVRVQPGMNWKQLIEQMKTLHFEQKFYFGLRLAHELLDMPLPEELSHRAMDSPILKSLTIDIRKRIFQVKNCEDSGVFKLISDLFTMDRTRDKLRYLAYITRRLKKILKHLSLLYLILNSFEKYFGEFCLFQFINLGWLSDYIEGYSVAKF